MVDDDILVITHPLAPASENHVEALLDILGALTSVALVTMNLSEDSSVRQEHSVLELSKKGAGESIPVAAARFLANQFRMCRIIARRDEDTVLFYGAVSYLLPILVARAIGRTVVVEPKGDVPLTLRLHWEKRVPVPVARVLAGSVWMLERAGYHLAHGIVTYTPAMASELGLDEFEQKLYPRGARYVDTERFRPERQFEEREQTVGFLGRLDEEKGIRTLADVARELPEGFTFRFVGDGDLRLWLERELAAERADSQVEFAGWVDREDVPRELNDFRLLVLLSEPTEGLPTVILESMACGTPVYATPVSGVPDLIREGETGFLLETSEPAAIAERITEILRSEELPAVSENGRELIEQEYSFEAAVERYREILETL